MTFDYLSHGEVLFGVSCALLIFLGWLASSAYLHSRSLAAVPIRIHVAGSRGKTSTARLIAAGLRASGLKVLAKTTGTIPLLILPDGREQKWTRWGPSTITEQIRFFRKAARSHVDAVVLESMAVAPEYLWASEKYLVRATHVVITNARPDHAEVLGHDPDAMAQALSLLMPRQGRVVLTKEAAVACITRQADKRGNIMNVVDADGFSPDDSNTRLAMEVCTQLGVDEHQAKKGMASAGTDPGAFFVYEVLNAHGQKLRFYNAFACNDTQSFQQLWLANQSQGTPVVLLNARADRPVRTRDFLEVLATLTPPVSLVLAGQWSARWLKGIDFGGHKVTRLKARRAEDALIELAALSPEPHIWGVGNYYGIGEKLIRHVKQKAAQC